MPIKSPLAVVQAQLDAYNAKDITALLNTYAPDAEQYTLHGERLAQGRDEMRARFLIRFAEPDLNARLLTRTVMGNVVVDHELITRNFPEGRGTVEMLCVYQVMGEHIQKASFALGEKRLSAESNNSASWRGSPKHGAPTVVRMPAFNQVTLQTKRLLLRPLRHADAEAVFRMFTDTKFMEFVTSPPFGSLEEAHALVTRDMSAMASGERIRLGIERVEDGALIGNCTLFRLDEESRKAEIGYGLLGSAFGKGYMNEALISLLEYGFSTLNLNRVQAEIDPKNTNSAKSLERIGFSKEGVLRESCIANGAISDSALYGLLQSEWMKRETGAVR